MKYSILVIFFIPFFSIAQDRKGEFFLGYDERNPSGYKFSGFVIGTNYKLNKIALINNFVSNENYYVSIEIGYSTLNEVPKVYTRNGDMQTVKIGYQFKTYYQFYYLLRFRIDAVNDPSYHYNAPRNNDYPMKSFTAYGPELMIGKKFNVLSPFFFDLGVGLTYNWSYEVLSGNGLFEFISAQSYSWINHWTKGSLKIGYHF